MTCTIYYVDEGDKLTGRARMFCQTHNCYANNPDMCPVYESILQVTAVDRFKQALEEIISIAATQLGTRQTLPEMGSPEDIKAMGWVSYKDYCEAIADKNEEIEQLKKERDDALKEAQEQRHRAQDAEGNEALLRMHRIELLTALSPFARFAWVLDQAKQPDKAAITSNFGTIGAALKGSHCRAARTVYNRIRVDVQ